VRLVYREQARDKVAFRIGEARGQFRGDWRVQSQIWFALRNWKRKAPRVSCERRSQQGDTRKNGILEGEKHIGLLAFRPTSESNS
jgi:hypothetical protein